VSHTVEYFRIADKKPANGQEIWFIERPSGFYGTMDMKYGVAWYGWNEVDDRGLKTGSSCGYNGEDSVEGHVLSVGVGSYDLDDSTMWCPGDAFDGMFE
jgi:hypothetical protein